MYFRGVEKDYLIVGQGIAGTVLAFKLLQLGKKIHVVDENHTFSSSKVAAGLYNPIVFKRIVKSWMVDDVLPAANRLYAEMENVFGEKIHHKREIVKVFTSAEERKFWQEKSATIELADYLSNSVDDDYLSDKLHSGFGCSFVKQSGNVDVLLMLNLMRAHLQKINSYQECKFDANDLTLDSEGIEWNGIKARKVLFCDGYAAVQNPYFNWLPFVLTKGEVVILRIPHFDCEKVINKGVFVLPVGKDRYKVGATYEWKDLSELPTDSGKSQLLEKFRQVLSIPFEVLDHQAGIRPTVKDRRPILGAHPHHSQLLQFNGMGTKAILLAPYFADELIHFITGKKELNKEVSIDRFKALCPIQSPLF